MNRNINAGSSPKHRRKKRTSITILKFLFILMLLAGVLLCLPVFPIIQGGYQRTKKHPAGNGYECSAG